MSYKLNQEKMTVSNTGKIATAAQADSATTATTATSATTATTATSAAYLENNTGTNANATLQYSPGEANLIITIDDGDYSLSSSLSVIQANGLYIKPVNNAANIIFFGGSPYASKTGGGTWGTLSDNRLKQNIRPISSALEKLTALNPCHFEFKNVGEDANPAGTRTGFIAQEFEQVLPGHTFEMQPMCDADKQLLGEGVKAKGIEADLVPYLVKAIQELKAELDTVKAELATLKG